MKNPRGEKHHAAQLTEEDVRLIRILYKEKLKISEISEKFEVSWCCIYDVCHYRTWKHIK